MNLPANALVVVADGRKVLFLKNHGSGAKIDLRTEAHGARDERKDHEMKSDAPGLTRQRFGYGRPAVDEAVFHQLDEERWAARIAADINGRILNHEIDNLIVIAPPRTMGVLRGHWHKETAQRLILELNKEMIDRPIPDIEALLSGEAAPPR
jgi:protein required for attachment to host cells